MMNMKKYLLLLLFLWPFFTLLAQRTEHKEVRFENVRGFSGLVTFDVTYTGFATVLSGKKAVLILEKYDASSEDLKALLKAGYDLRGYPESGYTPDQYSFVVQGQAKIGMLSFYGSTENKAIGLDKLQLDKNLGDFTTPDFKESMKEATRKWQQENEGSHWELTGSFTDIKVIELYISEFEETIKKVLGKAAVAKRLESAEDAVSEAQKAMMYGNLSRAKSLLEKAYKLDPKNERMIQASKEYAVKKKEKDERDLQNMMIEAELARQERLRNEAAAEAKELKTLRSWQAGSPNNFSPQNRARLDELTKKETARNVQKINDIFEAGRERIRERSKQRLAEIDAEYERNVAALNEKFAREKRQTIAATERDKEKIRAENLQYEIQRLSKYGYRKGESEAEMKGNVRKMAAEIPANKFHDGLAPLKYFKYGYVNKNGDIIVPFKYDRAGDFHDGLASVSYEDIYLGNMYEEWKRKAGYINTSGREVIPLKYEEAWDFKSDHAMVAIDFKYGVIDRTGNLIVPMEYQFLDYTSVGLIKAKKNNRFGYLDERTGRPVIPFQYERVLNFRDGLVAVKSNGKWGFLDNKGKVVIPFKFDDVKNGGFKDGLVSVVENGTTTKINRYGRRVDYSVYPFDIGDGMIPFRTKEGMYGFLNEAYELIIPPRYDKYQKFENGIALVEKNGKHGGVDTKGNEVIPVKYNSLGYRFLSGLLRVTDESGKSGYVDKSGNEVIPLKFDKAQSFNEGTGLAVVQKNGRYGMIDTKGKTKIPFKYEYMSDYELTRLDLIEVKRNGKIGFLNGEGKTVIPVTFDKIVKSFFERRTAVLMKDGKQGVFNAQGKALVEVKYDTIAEFKDGLAFAKLDGKYGFVDSNGNAVIPFKYDSVYDFMKGFAEVHLNGTSFIINKKGEIQEGKEFILVSKFSEGIAMAMQHGKYGYVDENNRLLTSFKYDFLRFFQDGMGMVAVQKDAYSRLYGFVDRSGKEVIPPKYDNFDLKEGKYYNYYYFENGLVKAELNDKYGFINKEGKEVIPVIYRKVGEFSEGMVCVNNYGLDGFPESQRGKWGYYDLDGNKVIDFRFSEARNFSDGYAYVEKGESKGFIDRTGKVVIPFTEKYKRISDFIDGIAIARNAEAWGFIDKKGQAVLPFEFTDINAGNGYVALQKDNKYGVVDKNGKTIIPFKYNRLFFELGGFMSNDKVTDFIVSMESDKWGLIRLSDGKQITSNKYDFISSFYDHDLTTFRMGDKWGVLDRDGRELLPAQYDVIKYYADAGFLAVSYNKKWGIVNKFGGIVIPVKYESIYRDDDEIIAVQSTGVKDIYNSSNFEIVSM